MSVIFTDVAEEELGSDGVDAIVGISINGILFAYEIAAQLDVEVAIYRNVDGEPGSGSLSSKYGQVSGKRVAIVDDVLSSGVTMRRTIEAMRAVGADVVLCMVLLNKTELNSIEGIPLRGMIRAVPV